MLDLTNSAAGSGMTAALDDDGHLIYQAAFMGGALKTLKVASKTKMPLPATVHPPPTCNVM
jgi:hypothetical protein